MKDALTSFDLRALVAEWQPLVGGDVDKVYQARDEVILRLNVPGAGRRELYCKAGKWLVLRETEEKPESPPAFAMALRRAIDNARLETVEQRGFDRVGFRAAVRAAKGPVVKVLAAVLNLGGTYAEELCLRAGVRKDATAKDLADADLDALYTALNNVAVAVDQERRPAVVLQEARAVDAAPIDLALHAGLERREDPTLNEALAAFPEMTRAEAPAGEDATAGLRHRIAQLQENVESLRREAVDAEAKALFLYAHFRLFDELLRAGRGDRAFDDVQVKGIDRERGTVTVAIGDFDSLVLDYRTEVNVNAQALYDARREAQRKSERVLEAIRAAEDEVRAVERKTVKAARRPKATPTRRFWFEAYRWCLSSEGFLILGGRDAKTNDSLVRKHLKDGDRYAHADIHGAPSVVVKDGSKAGDATLREACELALIYSKAWPAGLRSEEHTSELQ